MSTGYIVKGLVGLTVLLLVSCSMAPGPASRPSAIPASADHASADALRLAEWVIGHTDASLGRIGDSHFVESAKDAILFSDIGFTPPLSLRRVSYDAIQARLSVIHEGAIVDPAVVITHSQENEPTESRLTGPRIMWNGSIADRRYYFVEVALGNMAIDRFKIVFYQEDGVTRGRILWMRQT